MTDISTVQAELLERVKTHTSPREVLRASELKELAGQIRTIPAEQRAEFGKQLNELKLVITSAIEARRSNQLTLLRHGILTQVVRNCFPPNKERHIR
jgi:hypothetical protein